jgi:hypothetical protein
VSDSCVPFSETLSRSSIGLTPAGRLPNLTACLGRLSY